MLKDGGLCECYQSRVKQSKVYEKGTYNPAQGSVGMSVMNKAPWNK
jgi:hypothetical protein